jgi:surface antigen
MKRYLLAIAGIALLCPQLASAQPNYGPGYDRRGGYDNRQSNDRQSYDRQTGGAYYQDQSGRGYGDCHRDQQNQQATNAAIGAAAGGLLGNQVAGRGSRTGGTIAGVLLGAVAGYALTGDVDCNDRNYAEPTYYRGLEGPVGRRTDWRNTQDNDRGSFTPTREYRRDNYTCRDYNATTYRDGRQMRRNGSACRYEDGNWYFQ